MREAQANPSAGRGVGPTLLHRLVQDRSVRLASALAVAVAIPVAVLFYFQFRSLHDLEQTSTVVLRQLSQETADGLTKSIEEALKRPHISVLLRIYQARTEPLDLAWIEPIFIDGLKQSPFIDTFYVWSAISSEHAGEVLVIDRETPRDAAMLPGSRFRTNASEGDFLVRQMSELSARKRAIVAFQAPINGRASHVQAQLRFNNAARDRLTSFVAFAVDSDRLRRAFFPSFLAQKMIAIEGPTGFPPLVATVVDESGRVVFHSGDAPASQFIDERTFPLVFFDKELLEYAAPFETHRETWRLRTGYGDQTIPQIVRATVAPQVQMMAFLALVMAAGVFFVSRAAAREVRLAELKSNFVSSVSHDLKTPLALIQLFAETLELGRVKTAERTQEYYRVINSEARKLTRLINNILDFSRIEAGLRRYRMTSTDLSALTERVVASFQNLFSQNNFSVTTRLTRDLPPLMIDPEAAAQALENLLSNAMKYSPEHREIAVDVWGENGFGCIRVADRGVGVPKRLQRKIFRKFYRIEPDKGFGPQGSGLGLAIVDHIMRAHGGFVQVKSEPGGGSAFTLCFPMSQEDVDEADSRSRRRTADVARAS